MLKEGDHELSTFAKYLREQSEIGKLDEGAEVVYSTQEKVLRILPKGAFCSGSLTAFPVFSQ